MRKENRSDDLYFKDFFGNVISFVVEHFGSAYILFGFNRKESVNKKSRRLAITI